MKPQRNPKVLMYLVFSLLVVSLSLSTFQPTQAAWIDQSLDGSWTTDEKTDYGQTDFNHEEYETVSWNQTVTDFSGYIIDLDTVNLDAISRGFGQTGNLHIYVVVAFYVAGDYRGVVRFHFDSSTNIFGKSTVVKMGDNEQFAMSAVNWASAHAVLNTTNTLTTVQYMLLPDVGSINPVVVWADQIATNLDGASYAQFSDTVPTDLYRETVTIKYYVTCTGSGTFNFLEQGEEIFTAGDQPNVIPETNSIGGTPFITELWTVISSLSTTLFSLASTFTAFLMVLVPYLSIILIFYFADAALLSVQTGSIEPIGTFFKWIFDFLIQIWGKIIDIGQAVAEALPL